jgi:hypothetical protein
MAGSNGVAYLSFHKIPGIQLLVFFGAAKFPAANERFVYSLPALWLPPAGNGPILWISHLDGWRVRPFSYRVRASAEHPCLPANLRARAVDRMVDYGRVDCAGFAFFCSVDIRNFSARSKLAPGWNCNFLPRGYSIDNFLWRHNSDGSDSVLILRDAIRDRYQCTAHFLPQLVFPSRVKCPE